MGRKQPKRRKVRVWVNPQDDYWETGKAPRWAKTFMAHPDEILRNNRAVSQRITRDQGRY